MSDARTSGEGLRGSDWADWVVVGGAVAVTAFLVGSVLARCRVGFDFTDEGFYLNWLAAPWMYPASITQFGFIYHPLHRLTNGDPAALRQANILLTLLMAWLASLALIRRWAQPDSGSGASDSWKARLAALVLATSSLMSLVHSGWWIPTPGYVGLALQAQLLAVTALVAIARDPTHDSVPGSLMLGVAGWLAMMAKPTTAAALAVLCAVYFLLTRQLTWRTFAVAVTTAVLLTVGSAVLIDGSLSGFVWRLLAALEDDNRLSGGHSMLAIFRLDSFSLTPPERQVFWAIAASTFVVVAFSQWVRGARQAVWAASATSVGVLAAEVCAGIWVGAPAWIAPVLRSVKFLELQVLAVFLGSVGGVLVTLILRRGKGSGGVTAEAVGMTLLLAASPYANAFGSNGNYWVEQARACVFWVLAAIPVVGLLGRSTGSWRAIVSMATAAQCVAVGMLYIGLEHPYRQAQSLRLDVETAVVSPAGAELRVSHSSALYLRTLRELASKWGLGSGTPMIDLTGHYPGALYALGGKPLGQPWILGAYPGSERFAGAALDRVPCGELGRAWVLTEPAGPRTINARLLERYGIDPRADLDVVGVLDSPTEAYPTSAVQQLLKPRRPAADAVAACTARRGPEVRNLKQYATGRTP